MKAHCTVDGCENAAFYKGAGLCQACYQGFYYWSHRSVTQAMQRKRQLAKLTARMDTISPQRRKRK
jgi:hypothetical protein